MFNEDESGMFIYFDTSSLKVYVLRGTKTCARRRGYDGRPRWHVYAPMAFMFVLLCCGLVR